MSEPPREASEGWRPPPALTLVAMVGVVLLLTFPLYHRNVVSADVLHWGVPVVWGPGTTMSEDDGGRLVRFGEADRVDQGVTHLLQHRKTRRLELSNKKILHLRGSCEPAPCTVEVRVLADEQPDPANEGRWPWATLGATPTEQNFDISSFGPELSQRGAVAVMFVRTESVRRRDGQPEARIVRIASVEFR